MENNSENPDVVPLDDQFYAGFDRLLREAGADLSWSRPPKDASVGPVKDIDEKWHNIGIRIEDDVLVTKSGHEVLTSDVPKAPDEIEALMAEGQRAAA